MPAKLCFLGCVFHIVDYEESEEKKYLYSWKKLISRYGGEVEETYQPATVTHLMCKTQDSSLSMQALRDGKRLVTAHWLNDVFVLRKVLPPWKAVHFPLPAK